MYEQKDVTQKEWKSKATTKRDHVWVWVLFTITESSNSVLLYLFITPPFSLTFLTNVMLQKTLCAVWCVFSERLASVIQYYVDERVWSQVCLTNEVWEMWEEEEEEEVDHIKT